MEAGWRPDGDEGTGMPLWVEVLVTVAVLLPVIVCQNAKVGHDLETLSAMVFMTDKGQKSSRINIPGKSGVP